MVFAQDGIVVHDLAERFPSAFHVYRICGDVHDFQLPPQVAGEVDLVVALSDRYERVGGPWRCARRCCGSACRSTSTGSSRSGRCTSARGAPSCWATTSSATRRWSAPGAGPASRWRGSAAACRLRRGGGGGGRRLVVAKSRAALDAMACGRAVYVFDVFGGDGWVTPERYPGLEADNFAGQATGRVVDAEALARDLAEYRPEMGPVNRDLVLQHHSARDHVIALLAAIGDRAVVARPEASAQGTPRLTAMQWSWELTAREFRTMHWPLREHAAQSEQRAGEATGPRGDRRARAARAAARRRGRGAGGADGARRRRGAGARPRGTGRRGGGGGGRAGGGAGGDAGDAGVAPRRLVLACEGPAPPLRLGGGGSAPPIAAALRPPRPARAPGPARRRTAARCCADARPRRRAGPPGRRCRSARRRSA